MPKRWSKLQSRLYSLMDPSVKFQIHCALYEMNGNGEYHRYKLPRYFITIGKEIIFDYPKEFETYVCEGNLVYIHYPYFTEMEDISNVIEEYIQRPETKLLDAFENDKW